MNLADTIYKYVQQYKIRVNSREFWAPYMRNDNYTQDVNVPRGIGKSTPEEISASAEYIANLYPSANSHEIRQKLIDGSLPEIKFNYKAVDCSGFVFHVMDRTYREIFAKSLASDLSVPKDHVLNGAFRLDDWRAAYELSEEEANSLPEDVPMTWVVEKFKRQPQNLCRVNGLVSDYSSLPIEFEEVHNGDLIHMKIPNDSVPHVVIVIDINNDELSIAHSGRHSPVEIGGVAIETLKFVDGKLDTSSMRVPHEVISFRRLKSIAAL